MRIFLVTALALWMTVPLKTMAAEHWIRLTSPHFEMFTTNSEKQATAALQIFEQVRYFFQQNSPSKSAPTVPVRIVAFRSEKEFKPYRLNEGAFAYYMRSRKVDYIVMQDISAEHYQAAVHEYTHLITEHDNLKLPLWLNEGVADLYSSLEAQGSRAVVGRPLEGSVTILRNEKWLDLNTLFAVEHDSPYYNEKNKMSIFYAESWALTHMLALGQGYSAGFRSFMAQVATGHSAVESLQSVYGKPLTQISRDAHAYVNQASVKAAIFDVKLGKQELEPEVSDLAPLQVDLALADLLASKPQTMAQAGERLGQMAQAHPESAEVQESLGYLAWTEDHRDQARAGFKKAMDLGSKDIEMLFHYSQLMRETDAPAEQRQAVLRRVVELKPDYQPAWMDLGMELTQAQQYKSAIESFSHVRSIKSEEAYRLFSAWAYCYLRENELPKARDTAEKAKKYAANPDQILNVSRMLQQMDESEKPAAVPKASAVQAAEPVSGGDASAPERPYLRHKPAALARDQPTVHWPENLQHVEGITKSFDCEGKKHRLHILVDGKEMVLDIDNPETLIVRNTKDGYVDFQCGAQKPVGVGVFYVPASQGGPVAGFIRELVF